MTTYYEPAHSLVGKDAALLEHSLEGIDEPGPGAELVEAALALVVGSIVVVVVAVDGIAAVLASGLAHVDGIAAGLASVYRILAVVVGLAHNLVDTAGFFLLIRLNPFFCLLEMNLNL